MGSRRNHVPQFGATRHRQKDVRASDPRLRMPPATAVATEDQISRSEEERRRRRGCDIENPSRAKSVYRTGGDGEKARGRGFGLI